MAEPTQRVIPMLAYEDAGRAADWIAAAFGFRETGRWKDPDGTVSNVNMELGDGVFMLGTRAPSIRVRGVTPRCASTPGDG